MPDTFGNIYLTYKARMEAEARLKLKNTVSQILVGWYSVWITGVSVLDIARPGQFKDVAVISVILSIAILAVSIFLAGQRYEIRAAQYRDCYLKLQKLYRSAKSDTDKRAEYSEILDQSENHDTYDHNRVLFNAWLSGKTLSDSQGDIAISKKVIFLSAGRIGLSYAVVIVLCAFPIGLSLLLR